MPLKTGFLATRPIFHQGSTIVYHKKRWIGSIRIKLFLYKMISQILVKENNEFIKNIFKHGQSCCKPTALTCIPLNDSPAHLPLRTPWIKFVHMQLGSFFVCLIWFFTSNQQSFSYIGTGLPGLNQYLARINVPAQGHNTVIPMRLEPATPGSRVKHSTTEPLRSPASWVVLDVNKLLPSTLYIMCPIQLQSLKLLRLTVQEEIRLQENTLFDLWPWPWGQGHTKRCPIPSTSYDLFSCYV